MRSCASSCSSFCEEVAFHLRDKGLRGRTITVKARFSDFQGRSPGRRASTSRPTSGLASTPRPGAPRPGGARAAAAARRPGREARGRAAAGPGGALPRADADASSRKDFVETADKIARVTPSLDKLRRRFGRGAVLPASLLGTATPRGGTARRGGDRGTRGRPCPRSFPAGRVDGWADRPGRPGQSVRRPRSRRGRAPRRPSPCG